MRDDEKQEELEVNLKINKKTFFAVIGIVAFAVFLVFAFFNFDNFIYGFNSILSAITPFFIGIIIAFVLNAILNLFEKFIFSYFNIKFKDGKVWNNIRRPLSLLLSYIVLICIIGLILLFVIPELLTSLKLFASNVEQTLPVYLEELREWTERMIKEYNLNIDLNQIQNTFLKSFDISGILQNLTKATTDIFLALISATVNVASGIFTVVISVIFSAYFLAGKEQLILNNKKLLYAYVPRRHANRISMFLSLSNKIFSSYVRGQLTECLILGFLCYIGMNILGLDYSLLISTIVTVCAVIPLVGAFVGAISGGVLLLLVNPLDALLFVIFFIILQQFEGNVIFPKVVGSSLGLPGVWTLAAVTIMGGIFGIGGILIGTPVAGVLYSLVRHNANERLRLKSVDTNVLMGSEVDVIYEDILYPERKIEKKRKSSFITAIKRKMRLVSKKK